jgi:hypothetical protein
MNNLPGTIGVGEAHSLATTLEKIGNLVSACEQLHYQL